ncbi:Uncharacterised protein [Serratia entomophila]|jgi:hypothetical protein|nr:Uncharacterised protein [Serratia entomophila]CAI0799844.1 Uncharacterised protein [Serratia entomophila]CAI0810081.1 Uncharacterised protein [Serratia entomophila]CAI0814363.1 Uncharacterised protein [Serratia entomophila]CAI0834995.1 Uncharacterised protein [Serratia entomophila]
MWNDRLKRRIRFSYWNELCVTNTAGDGDSPSPAALTGTNTLFYFSAVAARNWPIRCCKSGQGAWPA